MKNNLKPEQIRSGNLCYDEFGKPFIIKPRNINFTWGITPIPIEDKYLIALGFKETENSQHRWETEDGVCYENKTIGIHNDLFTEVEFVHQIQNYYFGVMKKDLEIKRD